MKIERDSFQILDIHGSIKEVRLQEMGPKRYSSASFDKNQNQIVADDVVQILEGKLKGKQGTIKYVYRHHVFIHSREVIENSGICVLRSTAVQIVGNSKFGKPTDRGGFGRRGGERGTSFFNFLIFPFEVHINQQARILERRPHPFF